MKRHLLHKTACSLFLASLAISGCTNVVGPSDSILTTGDLERQVFRLVNQYRNSQGLGTLAWNSTLAEQSRIHSQNMAEGTVPFSHEGLDQRSQTILCTLTFVLYSENVAYTQNCPDPADSAVSQWKSSPAHSSAMMGDFDSTGVGVEKSDGNIYYFTQIFIKEN